MKRTLLTILALLSLSAVVQATSPFTISGVFVYNNLSFTPIDNLKVVLKMNSVSIDSTVTTMTGFYQFQNLANGIYSIEAYCIKPWGGVNSTDALKIRRHFVGLELLTEPVNQQAADVNLSDAINGTDASKVNRRFTGLENTFTRGDWTFAKQGMGGNTVTVNNASVTQDFYGLCVGDVNGSNVPLPATLATVVTSSITAILQVSATGGGNVTSDGGSAVTVRGVCWNTSSSPTLSDSHTADGSGTGSFVSNLTGLASGSYYYVRAYATNSAGTAYGNEVTFATVSDSPTCPGIPTVEYAGKTYNTVQIGTQCWFRESLNLGTKINGTTGQANNGIIEKFCYNDIESNCDIYGALYQWGETMQYNLTEGSQGLCPAGWHVPSTPDFAVLYTFIGGNHGKLKTTYLWIPPNTGATNETGFTGLPGGLYNYELLSYFRQGQGTNFWTSTPYSNMAQVFVLDYLNNWSGLGFCSDYPMGNPVRCLKN